MRKALGPTSVVMLLAGSSRDVSMLWESCEEIQSNKHQVHSEIITTVCFCWILEEVSSLGTNQKLE